MDTLFYSIAVVILIFGSIILQGLRKIPSDPPYKGQKTLFGEKIPGEYFNEGWGFYPFYPYFIGFIPIEVKRISIEIKTEKTKTPDRAEFQIPIYFTIKPIPELLCNYINSGQKEGVKSQIEGMILERTREWCMGTEEGPMDWIELNQSQLEATSVLVRKIGGEDSLTKIPGYAQEIPTWILLRFFSKPRPTKFLQNEIPWAGSDGKWTRVFEILKKIEDTYGKDAITKLGEAVEKRRSEIENLRSGNGHIELKDLGIVLERLNLGDINVLGEVAKKAEEEAKEELEKKAEILELRHTSNLIIELMQPLPNGPGLSREQALEQVQLAQSKATKIIDAKNISLDSTTAALVASIIGRMK